LVAVTHDRKVALAALIAYQLPIDPVLASLGSFGWDLAEPLATLTKADVVRILDRFLSGSITGEQVTDWADLVECREDIGYPEADHAQLVETMFTLANPNLRGDVTRELAEHLKRSLL
jgi:hypothetical protein